MQELLLPTSSLHIALIITCCCQQKGAYITQTHLCSKWPKSAKQINPSHMPQRMAENKPTPSNLLGWVENSTHKGQRRSLCYWIISRTFLWGYITFVPNTILIGWDWLSPLWLSHVYFHWLSHIWSPISMHSLFKSLHNNFSSYWINRPTLLLSTSSTWWSPWKLWPQVLPRDYCFCCNVISTATLLEFSLTTLFFSKSQIRHQSLLIHTGNNYFITRHL